MPAIESLSSGKPKRPPSPKVRVGVVGRSRIVLTMWYDSAIQEVRSHASLTLLGFEVGRIPIDVAGWMSCLLDAKLAEFDGIVVDCPSSLEVGSDILLEIKVRPWQAYTGLSMSEHV